MRQISVTELHQWLEDTNRKRPVLLDVREPWEFQITHLDGSIHMPMGSVPARAAELDPETETVVICHHGGRSQQVAAFLERSGFGAVYNLSGGVDAWARQVDRGMPTY
jgi:rhodanese-related sulfurtransferase